MSVIEQWTEDAANSKSLDKGLEILVKKLTGNCHRSDGPGGKEDCQCLVCRAYRTEKAEGQLAAQTTAATRAKDEKDAATAKVSGLETALQGAKAVLTATQVSNKALADEISQLTSDKQRFSDLSNRYEGSANAYIAKFEESQRERDDARDTVVRLVKEIEFIKSTLRDLV